MLSFLFWKANEEIYIAKNQCVDCFEHSLDGIEVHENNLRGRISS